MENIEKLIARDPGGRGAAALQVPGDLSRGAQAIAKAQRILIATGFPVGPNGVAETDGPPGALFLGRALAQLGKEVTFATHQGCAVVMAAGIVALDLHARLDRLALGEPPTALLDRVAPDLVIAIELPGRSADGNYYNMRGLSITAKVDPLDGLLIAAAERGLPTVAVGDGGNEAGMGKVRAQVQGAVNGGEKIASVVAADHLIAAGISNWGAYGLVAALDYRLLQRPEEETALLEALVAAGALDGVRLQPTLSVDGLDLEAYLALLVELQQAASSSTGQATA